MCICGSFILLLAACSAPAERGNATIASLAIDEPNDEPPTAVVEPSVVVEPTVSIEDEEQPTTAVHPTIAPSKYDEYDIVTLLPPDAIPAIDDPQFLTAAEANNEYDPDELVLGVFINDEARAYSVPHLSTHEIVNDTVGGRKIAVTW